MSSDVKKTSWLRRNLAVIVGFLGPILILGYIFFEREIYPVGDKIYLRSDMYHQYAPFFKELYRKITTGESMTFSWEIGMGVNFSAIYAYYLASPANLLLGLISEEHILLFMDILILVKTGLAGLSCAFYLSRHFNVYNVSASAFALFYALSSYMAAFSWNVMWLDCMILLPFIALGLESLVKEKKFRMYTIALGVAIFSNYYIAIMLCIFAVLYFVVLVISNWCSEKHYLVKTFLRFAIFSGIAGGIGAAMILPEIYALGYTVSGEFSFPETWVNYFSIMDMMKRSLIEIPVAIFEAHDPNVYCTVAIFLLLPAYCICSKVNMKEKLGKIALVALLLVSFNTNVPNYIWHGFHFPNSLPARESFIYIFLVVTMMYEAYLHIHSFTKKQLWGIFAGAVGVILLMEEIYSDELSYNSIYISLLFVLFYMILFMLENNRVLYKEISLYLLCVVAAGEMVINSSEDASYKPTTYSAYLEDNAAIESMVSKVAEEDKDFYRIEKITRRTKNDAAWNGYKGVSVFSSMANGSFTEYLGKLGFEQSTNAYSYYGYTPLTSALLSVKYVLSNDVLEDEVRYTLQDYNEDQDMYLYKVNYCLPLGFMVPSNLNKDLKLDGVNPFAIQNQFAQLVTKNEELEIFKYMHATSQKKTCEIQVEEDAHVFVYVTSYVDSVNMSAYNAETDFVKTKGFSGLNHRRILDFGEIPAGTKITVTTSDADASSLQLYAYAYQADVFQQVYDTLSEQTLENISYDDNSVTADLNVKEDGLLYTSIIYDKGWTVKIDGKKSGYTSIAGALMAIPVKAGEHTIELVYYPQGKKLGDMISVCSVLILIGLIAADEYFKKHRKKPMIATEVETEEKVEVVKPTETNAEEVVKPTETEEIEETVVDKALIKEMLDDSTEE